MPREALMLRLNKSIMGIDPIHPPISRNPKLHFNMNPIFMTMRAELHSLKQLNINDRRQKLRELQIQDFIQQDNELREVGLAFINNI